MYIHIQVGPNFIKTKGCSACIYKKTKTVKTASLMIHLLILSVLEEVVWKTTVYSH